MALATLHCGSDGNGGSGGPLQGQGNGGADGGGDGGSNGQPQGGCAKRCAVAFPKCGVDASFCDDFCAVASERDLVCAETSDCDAEKNQACVDGEDPLPQGGTGGTGGSSSKGGSGGTGGSSSKGGSGGTGGTGGTGGSSSKGGSGGTGGTGGTGGAGGSSQTAPKCFTIEIVGSYAKGFTDSELLAPIDFKEQFNASGQQPPTGDWVLSIMSASTAPVVDQSYSYADNEKGAPYLGLARKPSGSLPAKREHNAIEGELTFSSLPLGSSIAKSAGSISEAKFQASGTSPVALCFTLASASWNTTK